MKKFWQFRNAVNDPNVGELTIYSTIGSDGDFWSWLFDDVTPKQFKKELDALGDIKELRVYINSDGGDVFAGQAIHSMLKRHKAKVVVYIDGLAASIASVIAMAGDVVRMPRNAMMMIHRAWTIALGNAAEFRKMADDLAKIDESIIAAYEEKSGMDRDRIIQMLDAETWMTAEDAIEYGFADEIEERKQVAASLRGKLLNVNGQEFNLSRFQNPPLDLFPVANQTIDKDEPPKVQNKGRTLSAENEQRIVEARDKLNEVLSQLSDGDDTGNKTTTEDKTTNLPKQQRQLPLSLYEKRLQLNEKTLKL